MANIRFIQAQSFVLQSAGANIGDTSITVQSFKYPDATTNIVTADLGDQCYGTLEPNNGTQEEAIQFTGVTQNSNGTATLTGVSSVGFKYPYSPTTGLAKSHAGGVTFVVSNDAAMYGNIVTYINSTVASGAPTASNTVAGITKLNNNLSSNPRARSTLVSQNGTGALNLLINSFSYQNGTTTITFTGKMLAYINGIAGSTFTAPLVNPRYDLIVYRPSLSDCTSITGTTAVSPSLPTPTSGDIVLASIFHRVGETKIVETDDATSGYIASWYEPTQYLSASVVTSDTVSDGSTDQTQTTQNGTTKVGEANATGKQSLIAEKFFPTQASIYGVKLYKSSDTGSFTGTVTVSVQADTNGSPSGSNLASFTISNAAWLKLSTGEISIAFSSEYESVNMNNPYWIVVATSTGDNSNHPNFGINTAGGYTNGVLKYNNSTDGWVTITTSILYFKTIRGVDGKIIKSDATSGLLPTIFKPYSFVASDATSSTINNSVTETTVFSKMIDGGFFTANSGIRVKVTGTIAATAGTSASASTAVNIKYNGTTFATYSSTNVNGGNNQTTNSGFLVDTHIINNNSVSSQKTYGTTLNFDTAYNLISGVLPFSRGAVGGAGTTSSIDTSQPGLLEVTFTLSSATATIATTYTGCVIEKIG